MMATPYRPSYDTTINTKTVTRQLDTWHTQTIDWEYPFTDLAHVSAHCSSDEAKAAYLKVAADCLREVEAIKAAGGSCRVMDCSGYWRDVYRVGMASTWPYWSPRPTLSVSDTLGSKNLDWLDARRVENTTPKTEHLRPQTQEAK